MKLTYFIYLPFFLYLYTLDLEEIGYGPLDDTMAVVGAEHLEGVGSEDKLVIGGEMWLEEEPGSGWGNSSRKESELGKGTESEWKSRERNGMLFRWKIKGDHLLIQMSSPQQGWVAIGFNTRTGLKGTHLIMGNVDRGNAVVSDRFIVAPGDHRAIETLGGDAWPDEVGGTEDASGTTLNFQLPLNRSDEWHHRLTPGNQYHVLMAFSREDDFQHHSMMRTEITIQL